MSRVHASIWWGPPKKFSLTSKERKISWLELFYDLVYVIVISRITHAFATHIDWQGALNFLYLFALVYWGWSNGSFYHDLHGSPGVRTRFMTLWQMMAAAALAVTLDSPPEKLLYRSAIAFAVLQLYVTYLWWSVGIYDKDHRKLNMPFTYCYLISFGLLISLIFVEEPLRSIISWLILIFNYLPFFINHWRKTRDQADFNMSSSMVERFGLLTIILFGENILGVINGAGNFDKMNATIWTCFGLGIIIVFALWWIFFALVADRECKTGFWNTQYMYSLYIPTLAALGAVGVTFSVLLQGVDTIQDDSYNMVRILFGTGMAVFLYCVSGITRVLVYPADYDQVKKRIPPILGGASFAVILFTCYSGLSLIYMLAGIFAVLLVVIIIMTRTWFKIELQYMIDQQSAPEN